MELRQLKYFAKTAQVLHFSRAAEELGIAQSALSQQIKLLEAELGCRLFDRSNKWKIALTEAGESLFADAVKILSDISAAKNRALQASRGNGGTLSMSIIPSFFASDRFFDALNAMRKSCPDVFLKLSKHSSANILARIEGGELDFGIIRVINPASLGVQYAEIGREKILLAVSQSHRFARRKSVKLADLKNERFIMLPYEESPFFCQMIDVELKRAGIYSPNVAEEIYNFDAVLKSISGSSLVAFVPALLKGKAYYRDIAFKRVSDLNVDVKYVGVWKNGALPKSLENFIGILKKSFRV